MQSTAITIIHYYMWGKKEKCLTLFRLWEVVDQAASLPRTRCSGGPSGHHLRVAATPRRTSIRQKLLFENYWVTSQRFRSVMTLVGSTQSGQMFSFRECYRVTFFVADSRLILTADLRLHESHATQGWYFRERQHNLGVLSQGQKRALTQYATFPSKVRTYIAIRLNMNFATKSVAWALFSLTVCLPICSSPRFNLL